MDVRRTSLSLVEYGKEDDLALKIMAATGLDRPSANSLLLEAGKRVASYLRLRKSPLILEARSVRAERFAGLIRLAPGIELEVSPKFLGLDDLDATWREDFFFLSTLSRHGRLLAGEGLLAKAGTPRSFASLVAHAFLQMYEACSRRPIRSYRSAKVVEFTLDGEIEPEDFCFPSEDGYEQTQTTFDRVNEWNATILHAARSLLPEVSDPAVSGGLLRVIDDLRPQGRLPGRPRSVPQRHSTWRGLHELSLDVIRGMGLSFRTGMAQAPGYVVSTWQIWEDLIALSARLAFGQSAVMSQERFKLGSRTRDGGSCRPMFVKPDCVITIPGHGVVIVDAKYKSRIGKSSIRIAEADLYEALAFARGVGCSKVALFYPALAQPERDVVGGYAVFERIVVGGVHVFGVQIEVRGISGGKALQEFASRMSEVLLSEVLSAQQDNSLSAVEALG